MESLLALSLLMHIFIHTHTHNCLSCADHSMSQVRFWSLLIKQFYHSCTRFFKSLCFISFFFTSKTHCPHDNCSCDLLNYVHFSNGHVQCFPLQNVTTILVVGLPATWFCIISKPPIYFQNHTYTSTTFINDYKTKYSTVSWLVINWDRQYHCEHQNPFSI